MSRTRVSRLALVFLFAFVFPGPASRAGDGAVLEIATPGRIAHAGKKGVVHRVPVRFNDDNDCGLSYQPRRFWRCADNCPDGACDHRTHEPVWDYLYVGGEVPGEDDLLEIKLAVVSGKLPRDGRARLHIRAGGDSVRVWPGPKKGRKRQIVDIGDLSLTAADLPGALYVEGVKPGTAEFVLEWDGGDGEQRSFALHVDVVALTVTQGGKRRFIYNPGPVVLALEPAAAMGSPAYDGRIAWGDGIEGKGQRGTIRYDPGDSPDLRRAVYTPEVVVNGSLAFGRAVRVMQNTFTGSPVATTIPERRREVEALAVAPDMSFKDTELPNHPAVPFSQAWFEANYTGSGSSKDPVKPINQSRLQYAPKIDRSRGAWGIACCYLSPYGVFISPQAYEDGLKLEDLAGVAYHELRHLEHYSTMYAATGFWHVLCRHLDHEVATHFMEADASSASLHSDCSWRFMIKCAWELVENYRKASDEIPRLPSLSQIESAVTVLQDIYVSIPADMDEFKRPGFECHIRPPLEVDEQ